MIQAILFNRIFWTIKDAREYMNMYNIKPIKAVHITDNYYRYRLLEPNYDKYNYVFKKGVNYIDYIIQLKK